MWRQTADVRRFLIAGCLLVFAGAVYASHVSSDFTRAASPADAWSNSIGMHFVLVPAGAFHMGSEPSEEGASPAQMPAHDVEVRSPFYLAKYPVTVGQFRKFSTATGYRTEAEREGRGRIWDFELKKVAWKAGLSWRNPGFSQSDQDPVVAVSWNDAREFIAWLNRIEPGGRYRLPTEAEREYATRAGSTTTFASGNALSSFDANFDGTHPWGGAPLGPFRKRTVAVGSFKPNGWGLYDMHGNVYEWCADVYHDDYRGAPTDGSPWMDGGDPSRRVVRGSSWMGPAEDCRSAKRGGMPPDYHNWIIGFRVARSEDQPADARIQQVEQGLSVPLEGNTTVRRSTIEERMKSLDLPGLGVAVVHNFQVEWAKGYGVRNAQSGEPVTQATRFQWASVTKPITAAVVLRLVQDGVLDLDRNVNDYLKSWKVPDNEFTRNEKVTLRRLLSHTAGVTVSGFRGYAHDEAVPTILQVLDGIAPANSQPIRVDMTPGSAFRYSGGGYTIVQLLLEDVTGRPMADLARQYVFVPAGMTTASIGLQASGVGRAELSSAHVQKGIAEPGYRFLSAGSGCCELWATPTDVARFVVAIQRSFRGDRNALLSRGLATTMLTAAPPSQMGLGFELDGRVSGSFSHGGGNPGFSTFIVGNSESGDGLAVACNALVSHIIGEIRDSVARAYAWPNVAGPAKRAAPKRY